MFAIIFLSELVNMFSWPTLSSTEADTNSGTSFVFLSNLMFQEPSQQCRILICTCAVPVPTSYVWLCKFKCNYKLCSSVALGTSQLLCGTCDSLHCCNCGKFYWIALWYTGSDSNQNWKSIELPLVGLGGDALSGEGFLAVSQKGSQGNLTLIQWQ